MGLFGNKEDKKKELLESAQKLADQGDTPKALKELQKALELDPNYKEAHTAMGFIYSDMGQSDDAVQVFKKVISIDNNSPEAWNNLGLMLARSEKYKEAIKTFEDAIARNPKTATFYNNLGNVYYELGQFSQAMQVFQTAVELDPSYAESYHRLGIDKNTAGNMEVAMKRLEEAAKSGKNKAKVAYDMGTLYAKQELHDKAIKSFQDATRLDGRFEAAYMAMGFAYERKGDLQKALETFAQVITLNPQSAKIHNTVGLIYDKLRLYKQAIKEYRIAIQLEPSYANAHFILGQVYENKGIMEKAVAEYEKFVRIHETGAMVDEAKSRIAKIKNISLDELEKLLNMKKLDAPASAETAPKEPIPSSIDALSSPTPAPTPPNAAPLPAETGGVKLTDPKEYLKQVLAKAKAAKNPQGTAPTTASSTQAATETSESKPMATAVLTSPVSILEPPSVSIPSITPHSTGVPTQTDPIPPIESVQPSSRQATDLSKTTLPPIVPIAFQAQPVPVVEISAAPIELAATEVLHTPYSAEEETNSSIPVYNPDQPLPASALDGYVLDEQEVLNAIVQVDTQNVEQEAQVLEAVEAMRASHITGDELLEDSPQMPPIPISIPSLSSIPKPPTAPPIPTPLPSTPQKSTIKHGFF